MFAKRINDSKHYRDSQISARYVFELIQPKLNTPKIPGYEYLAQNMQVVSGILCNRIWSISVPETGLRVKVSSTNFPIPVAQLGGGSPSCKDAFSESG